MGNKQTSSESLSKRFERLVHAKSPGKNIPEAKRRHIAGKFANKSLPELHELVSNLCPERE